MTDPQKPSYEALEQRLKAAESALQAIREGQVDAILGEHETLVVRLVEAERALKESEKKFRNLFQHHAAIKLIIDPDTGRIVEANDAAARFYGWPVTTLESMKIQDINTLSPDQVKAEMEKARSLKRIHFEFRHRLADGTIRDVDVYSSRVDILGKPFLHSVIHDVTDRKNAEAEKERLSAELLQARKMEAVATLTGGIAHDYNNLLSIIMGNLSMAMKDAEPDSELAAFLNEAEKAARNVGRLTHELMALSRGGAPVKELGRIQHLLHSATDAVFSGGGISRDEFIPEDLWPVSHDPRKMATVFRNVVTNAVEAMPDGGTLTIRAGNLEIGGETPDLSLSLRPGPYVEISVEDQGKGIPGEHMEKLFDPYFSTKPMGVQKGMGLGLATAYAIVQKHGGHIDVNSSPGVGTKVQIYLPAEPQGRKTEEAGDTDSTSQSSIRRVLLMDDEEMLRHLGRQMLERLGYAVETVTDGDEAVAVFQKEKKANTPFDVVILDLSIKGGMGGEKTFQELRVIDPDVKAIVASGYFNDPVMSHCEAYGFNAAIAKPYELKDLKGALEKVIG